ncbi:MAG TPA: ABC transporter ATP-binding protein [Acidimicrobiia bacterium]
MSGAVNLVDLKKAFGDVEAVKGINVLVEDGEFFSLLGPSGCGKTTTLRLIAGFERPDSGAIVIDGVDQASVPPHKRPVNTVFQNYALFPHMDVAENVAFGLRYRDIPKNDQKGMVGEALEKVRLTGMETRRPTQLSGGQQQRVALARSLVLNPSVLLLDEPLGALDAKLRKALQVELKGLQEDLGITFIYVTHDQEEALTMSDRIAVMALGEVAQLGTPAAVYEAPATSYIAEFLGVSNLKDVVVGVAANGTTPLTLGNHHLVAPGNGHPAGPAMISIRPERIVINREGDPQSNSVPATVARTVYAGPVLNVHTQVEGVGEIQISLANQGNHSNWKAGDRVKLHFPEDAIRILAGPDRV